MQTQPSVNQILSLAYRNECRRLLAETNGLGRPVLKFISIRADLYGRALKERPIDFTYNFYQGFASCMGARFEITPMDSELPFKLKLELE